ncbi:MAG: hypothetical protein QM785_19830 [Pyrinomonadaceae bacterium]
MELNDKLAEELCRLFPAITCGFESYRERGGSHHDTDPPEFIEEPEDFPEAAATKSVCDQL